MSACPTTLVVKAISFLVRVRPYKGMQQVVEGDLHPGWAANWFNWARRNPDQELLLEVAVLRHAKIQGPWGSAA